MGGGIAFFAQPRPVSSYGTGASQGLRGCGSEDEGFVMRTGGDWKGGLYDGSGGGGGAD